MDLGNLMTSVFSDTTPQLGGTLDTNGKQVRWSKGAAIASAATLTLGTDGNAFHVTGITGISGITPIAVGTTALLAFDGAVILTHGVNFDVGAGGANITTAAGDTAIITQDTATKWILRLQRASGLAVVAPTVSAGVTFISSVDASNVATVDFTGFDATKYDSYIFDFGNVRPTVRQAFLVRMSSDGGATFDSAGSTYAHSSSKVALTAVINSGVENDTYIRIGQYVDILHGFSGRAILSFPHLAERTRISGTAILNYTSAAHGVVFFGGERKSTTAMNAIRFYFLSGNISSGTISMYGVTNA